MFEKFTTRLILITFILTSVGPLPDVSAQSMIGLPAPGAMVNFSPKFNQATLKGIIFHPQNPFKFDFIIDQGDAQLSAQGSKEQIRKIAAYFLASLTTPENEIWVNLSPFEKSRIVPALFGNTLMGQNLLAQDYMLKQIMATALYPERQLGREFWKKIYTQALVKFGTTNVPIDTFNKVWIVPDKAVVYENTKMNAVFVAESSLKVMLEKDYLAEKKYETGYNTAPPPVMDSVSSTMSSSVIKELVIPSLEKEVNEGKNFAPLRQVYNALILAKWYKDNLRDNVIAKGYVDRNKIKGVDSHDKKMVSEIYRQYLKAYKKGVFNYIKEDYDDASQSLVPRKYFSGGFIGDVHVTECYAMTAVGFKGLIASVLLRVADLSDQILTGSHDQPEIIDIRSDWGRSRFSKLLTMQASVRRSFEAADRNLNERLEQFKLDQRAFKNGLRSNIEIFNSRQRLEQARVEYHQARLQLETVFIKLRTAVGSLPRGRRAKLDARYITLKRSPASLLKLGQDLLDVMVRNLYREYVGQMDEQYFDNTFLDQLRDMLEELSPEQLKQVQGVIYRKGGNASVQNTPEDRKKMLMQNLQEAIEHLQNVEIADELTVLDENSFGQLRPRRLSFWGTFPLLVSLSLSPMAAQQVGQTSSPVGVQRSGQTVSSQEQLVLDALGITSPTPPDITDLVLKNALLNNIKDASNNKNAKGDPTKAAMALQQIPDATAVEYAAAITRQHAAPGSFWDKLIELPSNSTGGFSLSVLTTVQGVVGVGVNAGGQIAERSNVRVTTLRWEAARYLYRIAYNETTKGLKPSSFWQKLLKRGTWESLNTKNEPSDTVKASDLLTQAAILKLGMGIESRTLGGKAIVGLEQVEKELRSSNPLVKYAAKEVFGAIKVGDPDNRFQGMIERFLQENTTDPVFYREMAGIALKHKMTTAVPIIMQRMEAFFNAPRPSGLVELENWHVEMDLLAQQVIDFSKDEKGRVDKKLFFANLGFMSDQLTKEGATDAVNTFYLGFLFKCVQTGALEPQDFIDQLNKFRKDNKGVIQYEAKEGNISDFLDELKKGINPELNVSRIVKQGGPDYFPDLLKILQETTDDIDTVNAIFDHLATIWLEGDYARNNAWTVEINKKASADNPHVVVRERAAEYAQDHVLPGLAVSNAFLDTKNRAGVMRVVRGFDKMVLPTADHIVTDSDKKYVKNYVPQLVNYVYTQSNPRLHGTTVAWEEFNKFLVLMARVIVNSESREELGTRISDSAPPGDDEGALTAKQFQAVVDALRDHTDPIIAMEKAVPQFFAEKIFSAYLRGETGVTDQQAADALWSAYETFNSPSNPLSGKAIMDVFFKTYGPDSQNPNSNYMLKAAEVFSKFQDKKFGFESLGRLLNSHLQEVSGKVLDLFKQPEYIGQVSNADSNILRDYLYWRNLRKKGTGSAGTEVDIKGKVMALGMGKAIQLRINSSNDEDETQALRELLGGSAAAARRQAAAGTATTGTRGGGGSTGPIRTTQTGAAGAPVVTLSGYASSDVQAIQKPGLSDVEVLKKLNGMLKNHFSYEDWNDLDDMLKLNKFTENPENLRALILVIAEAQRQLGGNVDTGDAYQTREKLYSDLFQNGEDLTTKAVILNLFSTAPSGISADLFRDGLNYMVKMYPDFTGDETKYKDYFNLFTLMRNAIVKTYNPKDKGHGKYEAIAGLLRSNLRAKNAQEKYKSGMQYLFLQSINKDLVKGIELGIVPVDNTFLKKFPDQPNFTWSGGQNVFAIYGRLTRRFNVINQQVDSFKLPQGINGEDLLVQLQYLLNPSNFQGQLWAIEKLDGPTVLLLQNMISRGNLYVTTSLLLKGNGFVARTDDIHMVLQDTGGFQDEDWVLRKAQEIKRNKDLTKVYHDLQDPKLVAEKPAALYAEINEIGALGGKDMVAPLLSLYARSGFSHHDLFGKYDIVGEKNIIGDIIGKAIINIGSRHKKEVLAEIDGFTLPNDQKTWTSLKPILALLKSEISKFPDKAMSSTGGIDLENIEVESQGIGDVRTAFDDPAQLAVLIRSEGLIPVIENVRSLSQSAINQLVGAI